MGRAIRWWGLGLVLAGCAAGGTPRVDDEITERSHRFPEVLESGFAVTPVGLVAPGADAAPLSAAFTQQLFTALFVTAGPTPIVSPEDVLVQLRSQGEEALEEFQDFRRDRIVGLPVEAPDCTRMSQLLMHRYALFTWVEEAEEMGLEEMGRDYVEADYASDVRRAAYKVVNGTLHGVILDLWEAEVMWAATSTYTTQKLFGDLGQSATELERARDVGMLDYVALLWAP